METSTGCFSLSRRSNRWLSVLVVGLFSCHIQLIFSASFQPILLGMMPELILLLRHLVRPLMNALIVLLPLRQQSLLPLLMIYGIRPLKRPTEVTEIHVFRVILQSHRDKNACTRSVTMTGPMNDPVQTLEKIIEEWWDLEIEEHDQSWMLSPVNSACAWSPNKDLSYPAYVLTRKGNPFHLLRPHGVFEVVWGHRQWVTAIALPKWINNYHCLGLCPGMRAHAYLVLCDVV